MALQHLGRGWSGARAEVGKDRDESLTGVIAPHAIQSGIHISFFVKAPTWILKHALIMVLQHVGCGSNGARAEVRKDRGEPLTGAIAPHTIQHGIHFFSFRRPLGFRGMP